MLIEIRLRQPGHIHSLQSPNKVHKAKTLARQHHGDVQLSEPQSQVKSHNHQPASKKIPEVLFGSPPTTSSDLVFTAGRNGSRSPAPGKASDHGFVDKSSITNLESLTTKMQRIAIANQVRKYNSLTRILLISTLDIEW
jgi:hypothetical protein